MKKLFDKLLGCPTPIGHYTDPEGNIRHAACNSWKCPYCSRIKKKRVLDRVANGFKERNSVFGVTLTETKEHDSKIKQHWKKFRENLQRNFAVKLKFFWMMEFTPKSHFYVDDFGRWRKSVGEVRHLHVLFDIPIELNIIKRLWKLSTAGTADRVWINEYGIKKSAGYLAKYLTKSTNDSHFNRHERRYSFTHDDGFVLDMKTAFEKYGFLPPAPGTFKFKLGRPELTTKDNANYIPKGSYPDEQFYIIQGTAKRKALFDSVNQRIEYKLERGGYPDQIIYYPQA